MKINYLKFFGFLLGALFFLGGNYGYGSELIDEIKFSEAYTAPIIKSSNEVIHAANQQVRAAVGGALVSIPVGWRLVSVVPKSQSSYLLFFQDQSYSVHTVGLDSSGALSGKSDYIFLPATK